MKKLIKLSLALVLMASCAPTQTITIQRVDVEGNTTGRTTTVELTNKQFNKMMDNERLIHRNNKK